MLICDGTLVHCCEVSLNNCLVLVLRAVYDSVDQKK